MVDERGDAATPTSSARAGSGPRSSSTASPTSPCGTRSAGWLAIWLATWVRYEFDIPSRIDVAGCGRPSPIVVAVQLVGGLLAGPLPRPLAPRLLRGDRRAAQGRRCSSAARALPRRHPAALGADQRARRRRRSSPSWRWPPCATRWRLADRAPQAPERRGHGPRARVRRRRGRRAGDHRHAPRPRQPLPARRHRRRRPAQAHSSAIRGVPVRGTRADIAARRRTSRRPRCCSSPSRRPTAPLVRELAELGDEAGPQGAGRARRSRDLFDDQRRRRRHPPAHHRRPARPPRDRHRHRRHRRLPHRPAGARHRRRRLDRLGAVPPDPPLRPGRARHARPRRVGPPRRAALHRRPGPARHPQPRRRRHPRPRAAWPRCSPSTGPRSCSTPPPSSTSRCCEMHPERGREDQRVGHRSTCSSSPLEHRRRHASSTSPPTRPPTPSACSATPSASPSGSPPAPARQAERHLPLRAVRQRARQPRLRAQRRSEPRSRRAGRSPSPTPTSPATS